MGTGFPLPLCLAWDPRVIPGSDLRVFGAYGIRSSSLSSFHPPLLPELQTAGSSLPIQVFPLFSGPLLSCDLAETSYLPRHPPIPSVPFKPRTPKPRPSLSRSRPPRHLLLVFPFLPRPWKLLPRLMISGRFPQ
ncbi:unnamed protein product [Rangifer tarandus platyrhynchus]|uniref:Uncharacterized protein n=1 Tax=Rangifer tarandus platyrhynchus TaxID=3082113 RepID=A0ABN8ZWS0_RANTA|nr:unnamed protein product [Rangifer tarandus platyrhynchus]